MRWMLAQPRLMMQQFRDRICRAIFEIFLEKLFQWTFLDGVKIIHRSLKFKWFMTFTLTSTMFQFFLSVCHFFLCLKVKYQRPKNILETFRMLETWNIVSCPYSMYVYTLCTKFASLGQFLSSLHVYQSRKNLASDRSTCWPIRALHSSGGLQDNASTHHYTTTMDYNTFWGPGLLPWKLCEPPLSYSTRPPANKNRYSTLNWRVSKIAHICTYRPVLCSR